MELPKISIIVPIYNAEEIIPITIPKILSQNYPRKLIEIIIIDDGSMDNSRKVLLGLNGIDDCIIIKHSKNQGRAYARNSGIAKATGEILLFLDCDMEINNDFIFQHALLHKKKDVIGVHSKILPPKIIKLNKFQRYLYSKKRGAQKLNENKPLPFNYFIIGCTSIKKNAIKKSGVFNTDLPCYGEDLDFAYKLYKKFPNGLRYSSKPIAYHHHNRSLEETMKLLEEYGQYNVPIILNHYPELEIYVMVDFIKSRGKAWTGKLFIGALLFNNFVYKIIKMVLIVSPFPLSNILIRYLLAASVALGYRNHLKKIN